MSNRWRDVLLATVFLLCPIAACSDQDASPSSGEPPTATSDGTRTAASDSTPTATSDSIPTAASDSVPATTAEATSTTALPIDAPDELGPFGVGRSTIQLTDPARERPLTIDIWYPTEPGVTGEPSRYTFAPGIEFASNVALADVPIAADDAFPLVVYSHGSGGLRYVASFFTETLASHGFVVAAPDHAGNTAVDVLAGGGVPFEQSAIDRPLDVTFVIDQLLAKSDDAADPLSGAIDPERIGVAGHSFGGFTAFATITGFAADERRSPPDPRVDAIVAMAPATQPFSNAQLGAVDVPTMIVVGTDDVTTPVRPNVTRPWKLTETSPFYRVEIAAGGHQSFTDVCWYQEGLPALEDVPQLIIDAVDAYAEEGCVPELIEIDRAHDITNTYTVSFFEMHLAGDRRYEEVIAPGAVADDADVTVQLKEDGANSIAPGA